LADRLHASQEPSALTAQDLLAIAGAGHDVPMFYWERPRDGVAMLGLGAAWELATSGRERFAVASRAAITALGKSTSSCDPGFGPFALGGFGFSDDDCREREWREFPSLRLWVPALLWVRRGGDCRLTRTWRGGAKPVGEDRLCELLDSCRSDELDRLESGAPGRARGKPVPLGRGRRLRSA
jgi:hypothetical protein